MRLKVLKLAGETGLRLPGSIFSTDGKTAAFLLGKGMVEAVEEVEKELKVKLETKELKITRQTKKRK